MTDVRIVAAGDAALVAEFDDRIDVEVNARAIALADLLREAQVPGVRDIVPTFHTVAVYFDPLGTDVERLAAHMRASAEQAAPGEASSGVRVEIPVCYDQEFAVDIDDVARFAGAAAADVMRMHSEVDYRVFMLGFIPGFAYLGTVNARIAAPRRAEPRLRVPAGSVAIAGAQTGVYPRQSPGGWNIVGRTPLQLMSLGRDVPSLLAAGDTVRFRPIDRGEFNRLVTEQRDRA